MCAYRLVPNLWPQGNSLAVPHPVSQGVSFSGSVKWERSWICLSDSRLIVIKSLS